MEEEMKRGEDTLELLESRFEEQHKKVMVSMFLEAVSKERI